MNFAAEGGYQAFHLGGTEWFWLFFSVATAVLAILVGFVLTRGVLKADQGTPKMIEIATAIQEGAMAYLRRQFKTIGVILVPLAVIVFLTSTKVVKPDGVEALPIATKLNPQLIAYLNRLSDHLFVAARHVAATQGGDVLWQPGATRD